MKCAIFANIRQNPVPNQVETGMTKERLVEKIKKLLKTDMELQFLLDLKKEEIETLVACIRDRIDNPGE